jgi:hypothetical protein
MMPAGQDSLVDARWRPRTPLPRLRPGSSHDQLRQVDDAPVRGGGAATGSQSELSLVTGTVVRLTAGGGPQIGGRAVRDARSGSAGFPGTDTCGRAAAVAGERIMATASYRNLYGEQREKGRKPVKKTLISGVIAGVCVTAASAIVGGTPASANPNDCPNGYVCVWGDSNYEGRFIFVPGNHRANVGSFMNDLTTSLWNRTGSRVCFYDDAGYGGPILAIVNPGGSRPNVGPTANDRISSWRAC